MELIPSQKPHESLLIGLEELYQDNTFSQLRHALSKGSSRQRLYDILTVAASLPSEYSSFIIKMREALDHPFSDEFWTWLIRAVDALENTQDNIELYNRTMKRNEPIEFNIGLLQFLTGPLTAHRELLKATQNALELRRKNYLNEALKIFENYQAPPFVFLQRIRRSLNQKDLSGQTGQLLQALEVFPQWSQLKYLRKAIRLLGDKFRLDSLSRSQIQSKRWATQHIYEIFGPDIGEVNILCGWYGLLGTIMLQSGLFRKLIVRSFDIDPDCQIAADALNTDWRNQSWKFKAFTEDIYELDYGRTPEEGILSKAIQKKTGRTFRTRNNLIINASCEHLKDFKRWYDLLPSGTALLLQSNDGFHEEEHVNCVKTLEDFKQMAPMKDLRYAGELDCGVFTRFMLIGYK